MLGACVTLLPPATHDAPRAHRLECRRERASADRFGSIGGSWVQESQRAARPLRVGIDIGGTFTDLIAFDERTGALSIGKVLTTPGEPALGVETGLHETLANAGEGPGAIGGLIHGTTLVTNAL